MRRALSPRVLANALRDPAVVAAVDQLIQTLERHGIRATRLNALHHALAEGVEERKAALFASLVQQRLEQRAS